MRFLANENFPGPAVAALQAAGRDIVWVRTTKPGATDLDVLAWAIREERILLTFDKDFGELARASARCARYGIVLFRLPMPRSADVGQRLAGRLAERSDWSGHFAVVEPGRIRLRRLVE